MSVHRLLVPEAPPWETVVRNRSFQESPCLMKTFPTGRDSDCQGGGDGPARQGGAL